jgi:hypothetical protein
MGVQMKFLAIAACSALLSTGAQAATLDFVGFGAGLYGNSIVVSGATITNTSGGIILVGSGAAGEPNGFCSVTPSVTTCEQDTNILFGSVVSSLSFWLDGSNPGDALALSIFGIADAFLGTLNFTDPDQLIDLSSFGSITRLSFDDSSTAAGYGYSRFDFATAATVPLPASLPLLLGAIAAVGAIRRRKAGKRQQVA